jgi:hypothetical protein
LKFSHILSNSSSSRSISRSGRVKVNPSIVCLVCLVCLVWVVCMVEW